MKQIQIFNAIPALRKLAAAEGLPGRQLFDLVRLTHEAEREAEIFRAASSKVYAECGIKDGKTYRVTPGKEKELAERLTEIGEAEAEGIREITLDYRESMNLSVNDIAALEGIVRLIFPEENEEENNKEETKHGNHEKADP